MSDFNQILTAVKTVADSLHVKITIPSCNKEVIFRPLTTKQQKDLVKSAAEKTLNPITFLNTVNEILTANATTPVDLLVSDRNYVITILRALTLSKIYHTKSATYDLSVLQNNRLTSPVPITRVVEENDFKIFCKIPSLKVDTQYNNSLLGLAGKRTDQKDLTETLGDLFIYEAMKYIERVESTSLNINVVLDSLSFHQRYQLVEALPAIINNKIVDYITEIKDLDNILFKIGDQVVDVEIDQGFFTV